MQKLGVDGWICNRQKDLWPSSRHSTCILHCSFICINSCNHHRGSHFNPVHQTVPTQFIASRLSSSSKMPSPLYDTIFIIIISWYESHFVSNVINHSPLTALTLPFDSKHSKREHSASHLFTIAPPVN